MEESCLKLFAQSQKKVSSAEIFYISSLLSIVKIKSSKNVKGLFWGGVGYNLLLYSWFKFLRMTIGMHCGIFALCILACLLSFALHSSMSIFLGTDISQSILTLALLLLRTLPVCSQQLTICLSGKGFLIWVRAVTYGITLFSETISIVLQNFLGYRNCFIDSIQMGNTT